MKKTQTILFILLLLLSFLVFTGCDRGELSDISEQNESDLSLSLPADDDLSPLPTDPPGGILSEDEPSPQEESDPPLPDEVQEEEREQPSEYTVYLAACARANVNVRSGAGTSAPILYTLRKGDSLPYLERVGDWYKVKTEGGTGYLSASYAYLAETTAAIERVIDAGLNALGTPYEWGAPRILTGEGKVSPYFTGRSFDCSSFVQYCYFVGCGIKLGNYTGSQADYTVGEKIVTYSALRRGDFYFTGGDKISHVVIYLGGGTLLQTYSVNGGPVSVTSDERWKGKFISGRRPDLTVTEQFR